MKIIILFCICHVLGTGLSLFYSVLCEVGTIYSHFTDGETEAQGLTLRSHRTVKHKARSQSQARTETEALRSMFYTMGDWGTLVLRLAPPQRPVEGWAGLGCLKLELKGLQGGSWCDPQLLRPPPGSCSMSPPPAHPSCPLRGSSPPTLGEGAGGEGEELRQTYFQGFNPFCLKDFFFAWGRLGLIRGETQGADKLRRMGGVRRKKYIFITLNY